MNWLRRFLRRSLPASVFEAGFNRQGQGGIRRSTQGEWLRMFGRSSYLRGPAHRVALDCSMVRWHLYREEDGPASPQGKPRSEVFEHRLLELLARPCPGLNGQQWRYLLQLYEELAGEWFLLIERDNGFPVALWPVPPPWVSETPCRRNGLKYVMLLPVDGELKQDDVEPRDVIWSRAPNPEAPYSRGLGIAQAVDDECSQAEWMNRFNSQFFRQGGHPGLIIGVEDQRMNPKLEDRVREQLQQGGGLWNAFRALVLGGRVQVHQKGPAHRDLDYVEGLKLLRDTIAQVWGIPPELLGIVENSNRATADAADYIHAKGNILPRLGNFGATLNTYLVPLFGEVGLVLEPENPVRETNEFRLQKANEGLARGAITVDEWRQAQGWDPLKVGGKRLYVPLNIQIIDAETGEVVSTVDKLSPKAERLLRRMQRRYDRRLRRLLTDLTARQRPPEDPPPAAAVA